MRRGRILIFVLLIIIIGAVVGFFAIQQFLQLGNGGQQEQQPQFVEVYIAAQNIPQGEKIAAEALSTITIPQAALTEFMFQKDVELNSLVGQAARFPLEPGVVITSSMVGEAAIPISGPQWAALIPAGMTAVSLPADRLMLSAYAVNNGAHVNINACFLFIDIDPAFQTALPNLVAQLTGTGFTAEALPILSMGVAGVGPSQGRLELDPSVQQPYYLIPSESAQRPRMVCQMLLQDVIVMKVGNFPLDGNASLTAPAVPAGEEQPAPAAPDIVTVLVSPQDSITLTYLIHTDADLTMTLRNPSDQARQATEAATLQFLLSQYNIPVPAKLPYSFTPYTVSFGNVELLDSSNVTVPAE
jgi:pilus assembly protein CpaB